MAAKYRLAGGLPESADNAAFISSVNAIDPWLNTYFQ
jgi:hypothetical protein